MAYQHKPDHLKKAEGRPRQYKDAAYPNYNKLKQYQMDEVGVLNSSIPVIQLDYITGEYIDEYPSMGAAARDYGLHPGRITNKFKNGACFAYMHKYKLFFIKKSAYEATLRSVPHDR